MSVRQDVLKPFERKRSPLEERIGHGIEAYRRGCGTLSLKDASGHPVAVTVRQRDHELKVGANLFMLGEFDSDDRNRCDAEQFAHAFNLATLPFYWNTLEPEQGKPRFAADSPRGYRRLRTCAWRIARPMASCRRLTA